LTCDPGLGSHSGCFARLGEAGMAGALMTTGLAVRETMTLGRSGIAALLGVPGAYRIALM
jgi:hypothetical protein